MSLRAKIEAVIYAAEEPVTLAQLAAIFSGEALADKTAADLPFQDEVDETEDAQGLIATEPSIQSESPSLPLEDAATRKLARLRDREAKLAIREIIDDLIDEYASGDRGMEIREIAGGYRMATKAEYHDAVRSFIKTLKPAMKLSLQALETLAVVAYKQPVTAPEISEIRGVDTSGVLGSLISRKLITTAGRKQVIGRPILYKTTKEFLLRFGLKDVSELPSMEEFEKMAADMTEQDANDGETQSSEPMAEPGAAPVPFTPSSTEADATEDTPSVAATDESGSES